MANALYAAFRNNLLNSASPDLDDAGLTINATLTDNADYTVNLATHDFIDDVAAGARVATAAIASRTAGVVAAGTFDGADTTWTAVTGDVSESVITWQDTAGAETTDPLLVYMDTFASGMPVTPNSGDITIAWNASGIFTV